MLQRAAQLVLASLMLCLLAACGTTPAATPAQTAGASPERTLRLLWWQGVTILNPHQGQGVKDYEGARPILEPLAAYDPAGRLVPMLAAEIPTLENGGIAADYRSVTWQLKSGLRWSDGTAFSADDVVFTWEYCRDPATGCTTASNFAPIASVEALDPNTVKVNWLEPNQNSYVAFVGFTGMILQRAQFANCIGAAALQCAGNTAPIGTGPFQVAEFRPGDLVIYTKNPNYRDAANVFFERVELKGGGDAASAARAICETAEADYAWNLQVEKAVLEQIVQGGKCDLITLPSGIERIALNFANPDPALGELRSEPDQPHPILSDLRVRQAIALAVDRNTIAEQVYGPSGEATCNILVAPAELASPNLSCERDLVQARALLDSAGWVDSNSDGVRERAGQPLQLTLTTSVNSVRQRTQAILQANLAEAGIKLELRSVDPTVYFSTDVNNPDTLRKFYSDLQMYSYSSDAPDPTAYFDGWSCAQVVSRANEWRNANSGRYCNPQYDALLAAVREETDPQRRRELFIAMNDLLVNDVAIIPLIARSTPEGKARNLLGPTSTVFDSVLWNIAEWRRQ